MFISASIATPTYSRAMCRVPDRWLDYSRFGEVIEYTGILATKTPLKKDYHRCNERPDGIPPTQEFTPTQLVELCIKKEQRIGLVVDLTKKDNRYYDPKEFESLGVKYAKIRCPGESIPREIYPEFEKVLEEHLKLNNPGVIVVHCTRGVNRTGYLVCRFLMQHFQYTADNAIKAFNTARGHSMDREDYMTNIHAYWKHSQKTQAAGQSESTSASKQFKAQKSKLSAAAHGSRHLCGSIAQPHDPSDQYVYDYDDYQNDYDNCDDGYENPRFKGKNRRYENQWSDHHKEVKHKGKNREDYEMYEDYYDDYDYGDSYFDDYNDD